MILLISFTYVLLVDLYDMAQFMRFPGMQGIRFVGLLEVVGESVPFPSHFLIATNINISRGIVPSFPIRGNFPCMGCRAGTYSERPIFV